MTTDTTWRTDDPCPVCATGLHITTSDGTQVVRQDCPLCGWSAAWHTGKDGDAG